jgi:flagellar hook assembly protein FlgD
LHGNDPNPAPDTGTWIVYTLCTQATVRVKVYDVSGELVRDLGPQDEPAGNVEQFWDLKNSGGNKVASGVFIYRVEAETVRGETAVKFDKCAVLR